jgi:predicted  nucleic acid-binding Zn-ribbon protein
VASLEPLLTLQERDLALDRLRHRRAELPERAALASAEARAEDLRASIARLHGERDDVARDETRLGDEVGALAEQAAAHEKRLYSGEISSPRELQALQADVEQLRRHQRAVEDRQLAAMERREPLDERIAVVERELGAAESEIKAAAQALADSEASIDAEVATESSARDEASAGIDGGLLGEYERRRAKAKGVGAARLVGNTCQGCHLTIPATEVDRIRKATDGAVAFCDNCGCILVP